MSGRWIVRQAWSLRREIHEEAGIVQLDLVQELGSYERWRIEQDGSAHEHELKTIHMFLFVDAEFFESLLPQLSAERRR